MTFGCIEALIRRTSDSELDDLFVALRTMVDSYGGTAADQPRDAVVAGCAGSRAGPSAAATGPTSIF